MNNNKTHHFLTTIMGIIYDYGSSKDKYFAVKNTAVMAEGQVEQKTYHWRQVRSFVAWLTQSPGVPGSNPAAADIFPWCTLICSDPNCLNSCDIANRTYNRFA